MCPHWQSVPETHPRIIFEHGNVEQLLEMGLITAKTDKLRNRHAVSGIEAKQIIWHFVYAKATRSSCLDSFQCPKSLNNFLLVNSIT